MTIKEYLEYWYPEVDTIIESKSHLENLIFQYVSGKLDEQKQICADEAKINLTAKFKGEVRITTAQSYHHDFGSMGGKREIRADKDSILNASMPEI